MHVQGDPIGENAGDHFAAVRVGIALRLFPSTVDQLAAVCTETGDSDACVAVQTEDPSIGSRHEHLRHLGFLNGEDDSVPTFDTDRRPMWGGVGWVLEVRGVRKVRKVSKVRRVRSWCGSVGSNKNKNI